MEIFINEQSLHGQYKDVYAFTAALRQFMTMFRCLREREAEMYKNSEVFLSRKAVENEFFQVVFAQMKDVSLKTAFRDLIFNRSNPKDWKNERIHLEGDYYFCHISKTCVTDTTLAEVAERDIQDSESRRLLVSFSDSCYKETEIPVSKDDELLENAVILANASSETEAVDWLNTNTIIVKNNGEGTILENIQRFSPTSNSYKGAKIFKELTSNRLWYLDTLHETKRHFEVFDSLGNFIGSANLQGEIDYEEGKNKSNRKLPKNCL